MFSISTTAENLPEQEILEVIPDHLAYLYTPETIIGGETAHQLVANERRWENGRKLRVCFYNANPVVVKLIRTVASEWNEFSGVMFDFGPDNSWFNCMHPKVGLPEIRVGFSERGYWSYLGSDSERYGNERAPSMNFDSFNRIYNEFKHTPEEVVKKAKLSHKATIRHEFGHALALLHEHQNPKLNCYNEINWTGPGNIYDTFGGDPNYWTKEQIDRNLGFIGKTDPDYVAIEPDPKSVMMYSLPEKIFKNGANSKCVVPINHDISEKDKLIVSSIYPRKVHVDDAPTPSESIAMSYVKPAPIFLNQNDALDYMDRVIVDLSSDDVATRRNARTRLSDLLAQNSNIEVNDRIISAISLPESSYRYKLGVAVALNNVEGKVSASDISAKILKSQAASAKDLTLKNNLQKAQNKLDVK